MAKVVCCRWVNPAGCEFEARGETEQEVLELARQHAREHGIEPTPALEELVLGLIEEE